MTPVIELAEFTLTPGVTEADLLAASTRLQREFLTLQTGFIRRDTVRLDGHRYMDIVVWADHAAAEQAFARFPHEPACVAYLALMHVDATPRMGARVASFQHAPSWAGAEIAPFRLREGATLGELAAASAEMADALYVGQPGFLDHAVVHNGRGEFIDVLLAESAERAEQLCASWGHGESIEDYAPSCRRYLSLIEPGSAQMAFWQRLR